MPTSSSTLWRILDENDRIDRPRPRQHEPLTRAAPLQVWQMDFKEVTSVVKENDDKQMHLVETLNMIDTGTSILVDNPPRPDFNAETVIECLAATLQQTGCPQKITFDRDPRFVGSWSADDFPSPLMRLFVMPGHRAGRLPAPAP